jgi:selenocysteine lyase/cysteine desulfurase
MANLPFDVDRARADTRALPHVLHFNNAGSSLMPAPVADGLHDFLVAEEQSGGYETAGARADQLDNFYSAFAKLLNCKPAEVAYIENATRAWDMVFYSIPLQPGDRILTSVAEYGSNIIACLQRARQTGAELVVVPNDEHGQLDTRALQALIDERTRLICVSHIPTGGGLVNPVSEIGRIANDANVPFLLDACQSMGHMPVDVAEIGCDFASGTGRKYLRGPRGTGVLYISEAMTAKLEPVMLDQHAADLSTPTNYQVIETAKRFENWEQYFAGKAALGIAVDYAMSWGLDNIWQRNRTLADRLRHELEQIAGVTVTDEGQTRCGIVTFCSKQKAATELQQLFAGACINVSVSSGSGTLRSFQQRGLDEVLRASVHYFNTESEIDVFIDKLARYLH